MYPAQSTDLLRALVEETVRRGNTLRLMAADLSGRFAFLDDVVPTGVEIITIGGRLPRRLAGQLDSIPVSLWEIARRFQDGTVPVDVFIGQVTPPDAAGWYGFGPIISYAAAAVDAARCVVAEVNLAMLRVSGHPGIASGDVDILVDAGADRVATLPPPKGSREAETIAEYVATFVPDGATLQFGIGTIPSAFLKALSHKRELGLHTGAIPESAMTLIRENVFTGERKRTHPSIHLTTSLLGGDTLYRFAADPRNRIEVWPVAVTHDPRALVEEDSFIAVNSAFQIDLFGQVNAEYAGRRRVSSGGGQTDFGRFAHAAPRGLNIIALPSRRKGLPSSIVGVLEFPYVTTMHRTDVDIVVTEYGAADLRGRTIMERAAALASIAHPEERAELRAAARLL